MSKSALLALEDGSLFYGNLMGAAGTTVGEVVFNTSVTGYQEILTDPSYEQQIVTLTYPHIGNVGCNPDDAESKRCYVRGLIIRDLSVATSNWRATGSLSDYLNNHKITGISDIDTRRLTRILRDKGAQRGCITSLVEKPEQALLAAKNFPGLEKADLAKDVTTPEMYTWQAQGKYHVVVYDYGVKHNILRMLAARQCRVTVVPAQTPVADVLALSPQGIVLSNGPGDPSACQYAINAAQQLMAAEIPVFGICLGFQILGLAMGAQTIKMKFGHHGSNHPVQEVASKRVLITSQNHGFAVVEASLPSEVQVTHRSLFDGTLQGFRHRTKPIIAFQGHPEASPGPLDMNYLFDDFITLMSSSKTPKKMQSTHHAKTN